jgi:putative ABC transport system permease protein
MNIMMVSVTERTREIGLRMSVGARGKTILMQFLTEAIVLSTLGGIIGVVIGLVGTLIVAFVAKWPTSIPLIWIVISVGFSAVVGVFFGYYPARKAARLHPIEALRFE